MFKNCFIFLLTILSFFILNNKIYSSPVGKGLSCEPENEVGIENHEIFRGLFFESNKLVRVVSFKNKNNSLKTISKVTPYKISNEFIMFKIKFIWYGNISFENFILNRKTLNMKLEKNNNKFNFKCEMVLRNFMYEMNEIKSRFQTKYEDKLKLDGI
tara:strand:- start:81 stop:551 length:471 start_codon:yes stop_codon:yes gene_type:complete